jgi:opacity protein-like surface antigen
MMGKFATASALTLLVLTMLLGSSGFAQTTPAGQTPAATPATAAQEPAEQNPAAPAPAASVPAASAPTASAPTASAPTAQQPANGQEPADEESTSRRKKPRDYKKWMYNVGAGANVDSGATRTWVRGGGGVGAVGVARNANKYLGLRADFIVADLPLRDSTQQLVQASGATSYALAGTLDPIIYLPVTKLYSGYVLFGPGFYHRGGSLQSDATVPGAACNAFWTWWGACPNSVSIPLSGSFVNSSQNQFGYNFGGGVARRMPSGVEIYAEYRFMHGSGNGITTDFRPITIGFRW